MDFDGLIRKHLEAANHNDFDTMDELFNDDYTLELPQSGERIKGKAKVRDLHVNYPAKGAVRHATRCGPGRASGVGRDDQATTMELR